MKRLWTRFTNWLLCIDPEDDARWERIMSEIDALIADRDALRAELVEAYEEVLLAHGEPEPCGWIDTMASSTANLAGIRLVELGVYERDGSRGDGRRRWYRRKETT